MSKSPEEYAHIEWLGYVQPIGLVVSIPAMLQAQCSINKNIIGQHARFLNCLPRDRSDEIVPDITDLPQFFQQVLDWEPTDLVAVPARDALPAEMSTLEVILPQYNETLRPTHAVPVFNPTEGQNPWMILVQQLASGTNFDTATEESGKHWHAAPQAKFERLLRETNVDIGLLTNGHQIRLVYSPRGESSGYITFAVAEMTQVAGRPMFAALHMLLCGDRLFNLEANQRLPAILQNSRKFQNTVSTELAEQVLAALYELMRGFQAANDVRKGELLEEVLKNDPNHVYSGLLTVLMRLVFVMYAEDRDLLSSDPVYSNHYSVTGLFERLREDAGLYPDTMHQRYGAWSQLITLFRLIYEGGQHQDFRIPPRSGYLFDPDRYPFLEGRQRSDRRPTIYTAETNAEPPPVPRVSDGVIFHVLENLLILKGERLSYRTLDVEQIGSVYETVMGFNLEVAEGRSIAIKPIKSHGAPATINLEALLETSGKDRAKWLKEVSDQKLGTADAKLLKEADSIEQLLLALDKKIAKKVTPRIVPAENMVLQPSDERRRSGSHYTPRSLTEPIVRTTLEPILKQLWDSDAEVSEVWQPQAVDRKRYTKGEIAERVRLSEIRVEHTKAARDVGTPHPSQILDLKICDPAMGSGAFLVEACRQLGDELIKAWYAHDAVPTDIPPDEDEVLYARRLIAQRCLYGVDKNVMAVDLAKLSLWLVTLAKDHAFTFLDHALRHGDSLVGLTREQIIGFHWEVKKQKKFGEDLIQRRLDRATEARAKILNAREDVPYRDQAARMASSDEALDLIRLVGDACVSGFFAGQKKKEREEHAERLFGVASSYLESLTAGRGKQVDFESRRVLGEAAARLRAGSHPIPAFHWEIEFPEVFARENGGFDAFVGNPPFLGGRKISTYFGVPYLDFIKSQSPGAGNLCDLVAYFFRTTFERLKPNGTLGLVATNTIAQGDTRSGGLREICQQGGTIFSATHRYRWPGVSVVVSIVHIFKGAYARPLFLDGRQVDKITAYLFHAGGHDDPSILSDRNAMWSAGSKIYGQGFLFDDDDEAASPLAEMERVVSQNPRAKERIYPYLGGNELNQSPTQEAHRFVIFLSDLKAEEELEAWPLLTDIVRQKVKPGRDELVDNSNNIPLKKKWWAYQAHRPALYAAMNDMNRVMIASQVTPHLAFAFKTADIIFSQRLNVFLYEAFGAFGLLQSRIHEIWARFFSSTSMELLSYIPSDAFETFPFPAEWECNSQLNDSSESYHNFRAEIMAREQQGLTTTYNRFHDPHEQSEGILELRRLHGLMDGAVLRAYGWDDLAESARCEFLLDYEEEDSDEGLEVSKKKSRKKKPWRLRWPDEFRDEVLARLLELNEQRHKEELLTDGAKSPAKKKKPKAAKKNAAKKKPAKTAPEPDLYAPVLERHHLYVLMLLRAWDGIPLTGRALTGGMILMLNDKLRTALLDNASVAKGSGISAVDLNQTYTELSIDEFINVDNSGTQQVVTITSAAPPTDDASQEDIQRLAAVKEYFRRKADEDKVTLSEEYVDAEFDFVST